ncbi:MAG: hypothetical protein ACK6CU_16205 [Deltaproteobacteria bacterium]|jgi:hypothetical protein
MKHGLGLDFLASPLATGCCVSGSRLIAPNDEATMFERKGLACLLRAKGLPRQFEPIRPARGPPQQGFDFDA